MLATCPSGGFLSFRSILHGRDLLREGLIWRVGDGTRINIHHDKWIPRSGSMRPLRAIFLQGITKVANLMVAAGNAWNNTRIDEMFSSDDALDIKKIAIGGPTMDDCLAWNYTKNGIFMVRSAYHLKITMNKLKTRRSESASSVNKHQGYLGLWDTSAPNKAKIHMWRVIRNGLAVGAGLLRRRIKPGVLCAMCGREEPIMHRFWSCQHSVQF